MPVLVEDKIRELIAQGYRQTSRKYGHLARLPEGKTGLEALREVDPDYASDLVSRIEEEAAEIFRRSYAAQHGCQVTLSPEDFQIWKRLSGE